MKLKTDGERETLRIVSFFTEKVEGSDVKQSVSAVSFLVPLPDLDPADRQSEVAEKNNAIFYAGLTEAEILHLKTS